MALARRRCIQKWEHENQLQLLRLSQSTQDLAKQNLLRAARFTSFLLYLVYGGGKVLMLIARSLFVGPELIMHVSPEKRPLERHEFNRISGKERSSLF